jgi:hypothetical protein
MHRYVTAHPGFIVPGSSHPHPEREPYRIGLTFIPTYESCPVQHLTVYTYNAEPGRGIYAVDGEHKFDYQWQLQTNQASYRRLWQEAHGLGSLYHV